MFQLTKIIVLLIMVNQTTLAACVGGWVGGCACSYVCVHVRARVCVCACACLYVRTYMREYSLSVCCKAFDRHMYAPSAVLN